MPTLVTNIPNQQTIRFLLHIGMDIRPWFRKTGGKYRRVLYAFIFMV